MNKVAYLKEYKYIRLLIEEQRFLYRASISSRKQYGVVRDKKYYEINYELFSDHDYANKAEAFLKAKEWLKEQIEVLKKELEWSDE